MSECIFCKIATGELKSDKIYEDDEFVGFRDIQPEAPVHIIVIPKKHVATMNDVPESETKLFGGLLKACQKAAGKLKVAENGYRVVINCNKDGGQFILHLHAHLLGGREMGWPPG
ncbi:MAG: histidine triad nucleotide-binding protein [Candidatus Abyssobacteria bacterium SURF_17]|uniref:Histidine triad nucleotide-binding protein n=1 Tax=Candidatus Abyssobacteria bacterium SURF_17 TaxID=2093361 RepID=A0A419EXY8_9BACT|nr:MAG: histidine triad nucleotide-binding protein [Candidatus Abyssubacteria bacterium SURF_17]